MRILIVEDDTNSRELMRSALGEEHEVLGCADGVDAVMLILAGGFDLVVLDLNLPRGLDGLSILRELRAGGSTVPVVVVTGRDAHDEYVAALDAGATDYLLKPFDVDDLLDVVALRGKEG